MKLVYPKDPEHAQAAKAYAALSDYRALISAFKAVADDIFENAQNGDHPGGEVVIAAETVEVVLALHRKGAFK